MVVIATSTVIANIVHTIATIMIIIVVVVVASIVMTIVDVVATIGIKVFILNSMANVLVVTVVVLLLLTVLILGITCIVSIDIYTPHKHPPNLFVSLQESHLVLPEDWRAPEDHAATCRRVPSLHIRGSEDVACASKFFAHSNRSIDRCPR